MKTQVSKYIQIGSSKQFISIFGEDNNLPLLVYLHGGPGDAALPLMSKYNSELGKTFNVVVWEQRGAGKFYYKFAEEEQISIELRTIDISLTQKDWLNDLLFVTKLVVRYRHSLYGKSNYNQLIRDFIFSSKYTFKDLIHREKGSLQSIQYLWQELMEVDFSEYKSFDVPVTFLEGRHDRHVSSSLVEDYYHTIKTPKNLIWFENSSHFPQWEESIKFNQSLISIN